MNINKEDLSYYVSSNGYMLKYKGINIGGAGIKENSYYSKKRHYRIRQTDIKMYKKMAERDIADIVNGNLLHYKNAILEIQKKTP